MIRRLNPPAGFVPAGWYANYMTKQIVIVLLVCAVASAGAANPTLNIDAGNSVAKVSPILYGLMTEEINHSYDGGLYAELVRNRAFMDSPNAPAHWSVVLDTRSAVTMALDPAQPLNPDAAGQPARGREQSLQKSSRRHCQRWLLGHSGPSGGHLPCFVLCEGRAGFQGLRHRLHSERRWQTRFTQRAKCPG